MGIEETGGGGISGILAERELQSKKEQELNKKLEEMDNKISQIGKNFETVFLGIKGLGQADGKKTILDFNIQQCWDRIKSAEHGYEDMDQIFSDRFAENSDFRAMALEKLSTEDFVNDIKAKKIEDKLKGMCTDEACILEVESKIKEARKGKGKKLF
ncbi:hypothetical protein ES702_07228 [subsurface metagenome]